MKIATAPEELGPGRRAVAIGTFDGVHLGHRRVLETVRGAGLTSTVVTFDPHPRTALGNRVELLTTRERRLELLAEAGVDEALVLTFDLDFARTTPEEFAERYLRGSARRSSLRDPVSGSDIAERATSRCSSRSASTCARCPSWKASRRVRSVRS